MNEDKSFIEIVTMTIAGIFLKIKTEASILLLTFLSFVSPIKGLFLMVGFAVGLDTIAGIYIARKKKIFCSNSLFNIVVKTFFYMGTILLAYLADTNLMINEKLFGIPYFVSKITSVFWIYIEAKSLDEKSVKLGNKPFTVIISNLVKWVKSIKKDINEIKE
jgi:ABC-type Mn2+/Zn2+ transport system permease subunit